METKLQQLEHKVNEVESATSFLSNEYDKQRLEIDNTKTEVKKMKMSCNNIEHSQHEFIKEKELLNTKLSELEFRSMRDNLIFYGIPETADHEDCNPLVKELIETKLEIDAQGIIFDRVHRMGTNTAPKPRPIVGKFHYYSDRERVREKSYQDNVKKNLKDAGLGIGIQRPELMREARKAL